MHRSSIVHIPHNVIGKVIERIRIMRVVRVVRGVGIMIIDIGV